MSPQYSFDCNGLKQSPLGEELTLLHLAETVTREIGQSRNREQNGGYVTKLCRIPLVV